MITGAVHAALPARSALISHPSDQIPKAEANPDEAHRVSSITFGTPPLGVTHGSLRWAKIPDQQ